MFEIAWDWIQANPGLAGTLATIGGTGIAFLAYVSGFFKRREQPAASPQININNAPMVQPQPQAVTIQQQPNTLYLTMDQYKADLQEARDEVLTQIPDASGEQLQLLTQKREEFETRLANIEPAFEQAKARIAELETIIEREGNLLGAEDLAEAEAALANGDFDAAEQLLIRIEDQGDLEVRRTARAAYGRGQIAEEQVRWLDAAEHYAKAARLDPSYENLKKAGHFLYRAGRYTEALRVGQDLLTISKREYGETSQATAVALNDLAVWHIFLGQHNLAEPLLRKSINIVEKVFGTADRNYASGLNNLASLLARLGKLFESEKIYRESIEITKNLLGETHENYASSLSSLAIVLQRLRRYDDAEQLIRQAQQITKNTYGETHPHFSNRLNALASLLHDKGQWDEAESLYRQAIEIDGATIGETHPNYAEGLNSLASLLQDMGRHEEAEELYNRAIEVDRLTIGNKHPGHAVHLANLASLLKDLGRYEAANCLYQRAIDIRKSTIGENHPDYAQGLVSFGILLACTAKLSEARRMIDAGCEIWRRAVGDDSPETRIPVGMYAQFLREHFPDDPALAELESTFGPDIGK